MSISESADNLSSDTPPVDVAAIMRQVRRRISERQGPKVDQEIAQTLDVVNQQWDKIYEPLRLPPSQSRLGRAWNIFRTRIHHEVRGYLDPMIYRQTEFNSGVVRALNNLARRGQFAANEAEIESLRDEVIQLRERIRQLEMRLEP
jgi:hypothetical protein